jgi:hypothetical protein
VARQSTASFVAIEEVASWEMQKNPNISMLYLITRNYFDGILLKWCSFISEPNLPRNNR